MKTARMLVTPLLPLLVLGLAAAAYAEKPDAKHGPTVIVPPAAEGSRAEGDDCTSPIVISSLPFSDLGQTTCGRGNNYFDTCLGYYDGGEDIIYRLDITTTTIVDIVMDPLGTTWTGIAIDDACPLDASCIAIRTGSSGLPREILGLTLEPGSYYIMVDTWPSPTCIPSFNLTITEGEPPPPPPVNDTCDGAIDLQEQGLVEWDVNTCEANNTYTPGTPSCTGYPAAGKDVVYKITIGPGETFSASQSGTVDMSLYLVTDCADIPGTCVDGSDNCCGGATETVSWTNEGEGPVTLYLIVDAYGLDVCGTYHMIVNAPVPTEVNSWGSTKSMYR